MAHLVQRSGKAVEKSNFAQTCNLLSQFLKERGSFGNISHGITTTSSEANKGPETSRKPAATLNLLPGMENPAENSSKVHNAVSSKPVGFFPQFSGSSNPVQDSNNKTTDLRKPPKVDAGTAQMTIFYAGQVIVFDDYPAERAKEVIALASKGISTSTNGFTTATTTAMEKATDSTMPPPPPPPLPPSSKVQEELQLRPQADGSDLPIARRASLHRFFEKRKDRVASKAPYQVNNNRTSAPAAHHPIAEERNRMFIDLESECQTSQHLDLKL